MKFERVVITGATSSIGTALCEECVKQNIEVIAIIQPESKNKKQIPLNGSIRVIECAIDSYSNLNTDGLCADAFIHLAWAATQGDVARGLLVPQAKNIQYALDAVDLAERMGCKVFIGAGSQAEYGRTNEVLTENTTCNPETAYGMAKLCAGQMTRLACNNKGIRHVWSRILSAYGPNCQPQTVINYTLIELLHGRIPELSAGTQIWDFIYTGDVARALLLLADKGIDGEVYVIGSGESRELRDYLEEARNIVAPDIALGLGVKPYGTNTVMHLACNIDKLKNDTGFTPIIDFDAGIIATMEWITNNYL